MSEGEESVGFEPKRRKEDTPDEKDATTEEDVGEGNNSAEFSSFVAAHYNSIQSTFEQRKNSRIFYLRNFNNWIKSILLKETVWRLQDQNRRNLNVLDMGCGKGGDFLKWARMNVRYIICTDIAENSLEMYKERYNDYMKKCQRNQKYCNLECEFIPADSTRERLRGKYHDPSIQFDIVSCQFSFHYCFESLPQAECMLKNVSECLKLGGLFVGTIPNAYEIVKKAQQSETNTFGNELFSVEMYCEEPYPLFGAKYNFYLEGVVNCPEFLVYFPAFEKLALKYGLKLVKTEKFSKLFDRKSKTRDGEVLLKKVQALEIYPAPKERTLVGSETEYMHAKVYCSSHNNVYQVGTLSRSEWDVVSLYQTFVFEKVKT